MNNLWTLLLSGGQVGHKSNTNFKKKKYCNVLAVFKDHAKALQQKLRLGQAWAAWPMSTPVRNLYI